MDVPKYTTLDGTTHVIGEDEHTVCGEPIPHGNGYVTDEPKKLCRACKAVAGGDEPEDEPEPVKATKVTEASTPAKATKGNGKPKA